MPPSAAQPCPPASQPEPAASRITLDAGGRVVEISPAAARWAGVSMWQTRGRQLARELPWIFGAEASRRIDAFLAGGAPTATVHAIGLRRGHPVEADIVLRRACRGERIELAICA